MTETQTTQQIVERRDSGHTRELILNRPEKRNAIHYEMIAALNEQLQAAAKDINVRCVVISGAGGTFSSGADLNVLNDLAGSPERLREFRGQMLSTWNLLEEMTKPTIVKIEGLCIGGAMELALAADLRVASEQTFFSIPEVKLGLIPDVGGSSRLPSVVGLGRAKELIMTGKVIDAKEAERIGLVNRLAPAGELDSVTNQLVDELLGCAPLAVGLAKRVMDASAKPALSTTLELEVTAQQALVGTKDFAEGCKATLEKRSPEFKCS